jgi:hypothetical protein
MDSDRTKRRQIFAALSQSFGKLLPAAFLKNPGLPAVERIHPLTEGIHKPAWSNYALSITTMLKSPYHDQTHFNSDGTWWMHYSPKAGSLDIAVNAAMVRCMTDSEPILVLKQTADKTSASGSQYRLLGLGLVEHFDPQHHLFRIRGVPADQFADYLDRPLADDLIETALRLEALEEWRPFLKEDRVLYRVSAEKRDQAFREIVLSNYDRTCAVTGMKFSYSSTVEAEAVHIIAKGVRGTDDPRNGMALSRSAHWAFDQGIFTISDQYEVLVHPEASRASTAAFPILQADRKGILLPADLAYRPHPEALAWHRAERFGLFTKA